MGSRWPALIGGAEDRSCADRFLFDPVNTSIITAICFRTKKQERI
jgi:hypothetical protein